MSVSSPPTLLSALGQQQKQNSNGSPVLKVDIQLGDMFGGIVGAEQTNNANANQPGTQRQAVHLKTLIALLDAAG